MGRFEDQLFALLPTPATAQAPAAGQTPAAGQAQRSNILVIDDIGWENQGSYNQGLMLEDATPNLNKLVPEGPTLARRRRPT